MNKLHECEIKQFSDSTFPAIEYCEEREDGSLWVYNMEYNQRVNYCPWCGFKAIKQVEK